VSAAVEELSAAAAAGGGAVHGLPCNVARPEQVAALADFAKEQLGTVDMWIK
jgi:NAD(P)-dependent dehydrogenase (short-subunit alcohol dehydrogenase family)